MTLQIKAKIIGTKALQKKFARMIPKTRSALEKQLAVSALAIHKEAVKGIKKVSGGKKQTRSNPTRTVTVSKPGDPPNTDRGGLIQSIQFEVDKSTLDASVGSNLKYAAWLEFGTKRMKKKRPWLAPAIRKTKNKIPKGFKRPIAESLLEVAKS